MNNTDKRPRVEIPDSVVSAWGRRLWANCAIALLAGLVVQNVNAQVGASTGAVPKIAGPASPAPRVAPRLTPLPKPAALATIQGSAVDMEKAAVPNATVRLRDARLGKIVGSALSDKGGGFMFYSIEPGSYVAEVVDGESRSVIASSQIIGANAGELTTVVLRLPSNMPQFARLLGSTTSTNGALDAQAGGVAAFRAGTPISER
ncbi:MAG: carboxypeptidase-like regulatory domain-containing protein [Acidobacteriota bacterium]